MFWSGTSKEGQRGGAADSPGSDGFLACYFSGPQCPSLSNGGVDNNRLFKGLRSGCAQGPGTPRALVLPPSSPPSRPSPPHHSFLSSLSIPAPFPGPPLPGGSVGERGHRPPTPPQSQGGRFSFSASNSGFLIISFTAFNSHANFVPNIYPWSPQHMVQ